jgi:hypothetical protein
MLVRVPGGSRGRRPTRCGAIIGATRALVAILLVVSAAAPARCQDTSAASSASAPEAGAVGRAPGPQGVSLFLPLVTRSATIGRTLQLEVGHQAGEGGRQSDLTGALAWVLLDRIQLTLDVPLVVSDPSTDDTQTGIGDLNVEAQLVVFQSQPRGLIAAAGVAVGLPTGSERRGLGGDTAVTPFALAGIKLGPLDLQAEIDYSWTLGGPDRDAQAILSNLAVGYTALAALTPFIELNVVRQTRGLHARDPLTDRTQVYLTPVVSISLFRGTFVDVGVQLPVTTRRQFDYQVAGLVNWGF